MNPLARHPQTIHRSATGKLFLLLLLLLAALSSGDARAQAEINVSQGGNNLSSGNPGDTIDFGNVDIGSPPRSLTFTIRNSGNIVLGVSGITKSGANPGNFSYTNPLTGSITANNSTTFTISFTATQAGVRNATFNITNTDSNENPFIIYVTGTGVAAPEIAVTQAGVNMEDDVSTVNFGNVNIGITATRTFTIRNSGLANLTGLSVSLSGGSAWSSTQLTVSSLASSQSTSFTVSFEPVSASSSSASLTIYSNDANESSFTISLSGAGVIPIMIVEAPAGTPLIDGGDTIAFAAPVGGSTQRTVTIKNVSGSPLTGLAVTLDGAGAGDFAAGSLPASSIVASGVMTFTVTFTPPGPGDSSAALHIASDQAPGDPFDINLIGTGLELADLSDEDGDGALNMLERAAGTDPLVGGPHPGVLVKNGASLEMTFYRRDSLIGVIDLTVEWSDDPAGAWNTVDTSFASLLDDDGTLQTIRYIFPAGSTGHRFVRLRATRL